jgi:hypothetical protein
MFFEWLTQFEEAMIGVERLDQYLRMDLEKGNKLPKMSLFQWKLLDHNLSIIKGLPI